MKISYQNNVIGLSAETPEERAICALLDAADIWMRIRARLQQAEAARP